jgi:hypothetical protein
MPSTPGHLAKFDPRGNVTDSGVTETDNGSIGVGTVAPTAKVEIRVGNEGDWALKLQSGPNDFLAVRPTNFGGRFQTELDTLNDRDLIILAGTGNVGIGTPSPSTRTQIEGSDDPSATLAIRRADNNKFMRLGVGTQGVALDFDPSSFLVIQKNLLGIDGHLAGQELLRVTADGKVGIGTPTPLTSLHIAGYLLLDPQDNPVLFTGTADVEQNRYLQLINSPDVTSASGLKAGGVLVADDYTFGNPSKNDLIVKGSVAVGGDVTMDGTLTATSATIRGEVPEAAGSIVLDQDFNGAHVLVVSPRQVPGSGGIVQLTSVPGAPDNGAVFVTDAAGSATGIAAKAGMFVNENGDGVVMADMITASVKNFRVPHPGHPDLDIVYACLEGPEAAVYARGTAHLVNGEAVVSLPDHFSAVAAPGGMTIQVTPLSARSLGLAVVAKRPDRIEVKELYHGTGDYEFDWEVKAVRRGHEDYRATRPRSEMALQRRDQ